MSFCNAATQAAGNGVGNGGSSIETSLGKSWAENASEGMADGLSADACGVVFPMKKGGVVAGSVVWFCLGGGVQFCSSFFKYRGQCFWFIASVEEVGEEG